jgi:hypothetical protein
MPPIATPSPVVDRPAFVELVEGWCELALGGYVRTSLLLVGLADAAVVDDLAPRLVRHLRSVDVVGRFDRRTLAVLVDADAAGARRCADRIAEVIASDGGGPGWIGLVSSEPGVAPAEVVRSAGRSLDEARRHLPGTVVVGGAGRGRPITWARGRSLRRTPRAALDAPGTTALPPPPG